MNQIGRYFNFETGMKREEENRKTGATDED
jgi:hypothetical protein